MLDTYFLCFKTWSMSFCLFAFLMDPCYIKKLQNIQFCVKWNLQNDLKQDMLPWWTSLVVQMVKHLPTMRETPVQSLGWEDLLEKEMATHSNILAWKIPWTEEPGRLQSMESQRVRYDWATYDYEASLIAQLIKNLAAIQETCFDSWVGKIPWRKEQLPTPVFWPGEFHGLYSPWGHNEWDTTEHLPLSFFRQ